MKQPHALGCLFGASAIVVMASAPAMAVTQITGVNVNTSGGGVQVILDTQGGDRPQVFTVNRGTDVIADIINTQLSLPGGQSFRQNNPAPGIASIVVTPLDANSVRVIVSGSSSAPEVAINQADAGGINLGFNTGGVATVPNLSPSAPPPPPGMTPPPAPTQGLEPGMPTPPISLEGGPAPIARPNQSSVPPFQPRAVAPPVGDIAVSNINPAARPIDLNTGEVIPRLVLRDAPVRDVLALLARVAGVNVAYATGATTGEEGGEGTEDELKISLDIENEPVQNVFNYVLRLSGLQANRQGNTVFVGVRLPDIARDVISRTVRVNQLNLIQALNFLVSQGAERNEVQTTTQTVVTGEGATAQSFTNTTTTVELIGADTTDNPYQGSAALPLRGVLVSGDQRTNSITVVGDPTQVEVAVALLSQIDVRRRQVAVNVKIIDVNLSNIDEFNSSFSFGINDSFFVNDGGAAAVNFGGINPPSREGVATGTLSRPVIPNPLINAGIQYDRNQTTQVPLTGPGAGALFLRPVPGISDDPLSVRVAGYEVFEVDPTTGVITAGEADFSLPTLFQYPKKFLALLEAQIQSRNAKILTDPTLVVQEGETARVELTQQVLSSVTIQTQDTVAGPRETISPNLEPVGLTLSVNVERIDDNGFISLDLIPEVSSPLASVDTGLGGFVTPIQRRLLQSGTIRIRDGQTLIISGIIQDQDRTTVSKVPILGDLPLIGSLFRSTNRTNERAEVIVLLTPQILDDSENANFGYGYVPGQEAQQMLNQNR
ncbi:AMIN domain-containing protein [Laspinema sp. A4]|uniref:AMIN domain-containing protein n=1 Tax=Laspinema sp. D2d TaxID=2953686 RepID=UPI0021BB61E5|nr:type IV pilus secretin family protein [Laspinema sp. D2d]MCT7983278.1 AMIN domain-containing protein [Laspinema sp. D2d]